MQYYEKNIFIYNVQIYYYLCIVWYAYIVRKRETSLIIMRTTCSRHVCGLQTGHTTKKRELFHVKELSYQKRMEERKKKRIGVNIAIL